MSMASGAQSLEPQSIATPAPGVALWMTVQRTAETASTGPANHVESGTWQLHDSSGVQQVDAGEVWGLWPEEELLQRVRGMVIWEAPYLLLERRCSGTAWTCRGRTVFRIHEGKAQRIGYLPGNDSPPVPATDSSGPRFEAIYDKLELGLAGLSHAGSPRLVLMLRDDNGHLVLDRTATCSDRINPKPTRGAGPEAGEAYFSRVAQAALVDKYCDRRGPLATTMLAAESRLPERNYHALVAALERVQPFEVPGQ